MRRSHGAVGNVLSLGDDGRPGLCFDAELRGILGENIAMPAVVDVDDCVKLLCFDIDFFLYPLEIKSLPCTFSASMPSVSAREAVFIDDEPATGPFPLDAVSTPLAESVSLIFEAASMAARKSTLGSLATPSALFTSVSAVLTSDSDSLVLKALLAASSSTESHLRFFFDCSAWVPVSATTGVVISQ